MKFMKRELEHNVDNTEPKKEIGTIDPNFWFNSKKKIYKKSLIFSPDLTFHYFEFKFADAIPNIFDRIFGFFCFGYLYI